MNVLDGWKGQKQIQSQDPVKLLGNAGSVWSFHGIFTSPFLQRRSGPENAGLDRTFFVEEPTSKKNVWPPQDLCMNAYCIMDLYIYICISIYN